LVTWNAFSPETLIKEIAPTPGAVAGATMVSAKADIKSLFNLFFPF
jgi:hypothetical protein